MSHSSHSQSPPSSPDPLDPSFHLSSEQSSEQPSSPARAEADGGAPLRESEFSELDDVGQGSNGGAPAEAQDSALPEASKPGDIEPNRVAGADLETLRQEFAALCQVQDPLEQSYQLLQYAKASHLPAEEYRALFDHYHAVYVRPTPATQEKLLQQLTDEFRAIAAIRDPIRRNYRLIQRAKASEIDTQEYRELFEEFERRQATGVQAVLGGVWRSTKTLGTILGSLTIFWGIMLFILEADARQQEAHTQAWQIITGNKGSTESAGRIQALQTLAKGCHPPDLQRSSPSQGAASQTAVSQTASGLTPTASVATGASNLFSSLSSSLDPDNINWRELPVIGGFFPDCVSLRGLDIANAHLPELTLPWADLRNARLQDTKLWSANLQGAQLQGAQLQRSRLRNASLQGANFAGATLEEADLAGASFYCPPLDQSSSWVQLGLPRRAACMVPADFVTANLSRANLRGDSAERPTHLGRAILTDVELEGALYDNDTKIEACKVEDATDAATAEADCTPTVIDIPTFLNSRSDSRSNSSSDYLCAAGMDGGETLWTRAACNEIERAFGEALAIVPEDPETEQVADLSQINLNRAELSEAHLDGALLVGTLLQGATLRGAQLNRANLAGASLDCNRLEVSLAESSGKNPVNTLITCTDLRDAQLQNATLTNANLQGANLSEANLTNADFSCTDSDRCTDLGDVDLQNTMLTGANLTGANLAGANLVGAKGWTVDQIQAATNWQQARYDAEQRQALGL